MPKILFWDLETSNLNADFGRLICFGGKFAGEKKPFILSITDSPTFKKDPTNDKWLVEKCANVLSMADEWVTWYGKRFDVPFLSSRLLSHGLNSLPPCPHIDGWEIARKQLKLHSNRLASVQAFLNLPVAKTIIRPDHWVKAMAGNRDAIRYIIEHCEKDVLVLEQAYEKLRPLIINPPNLNLLNGRPENCESCGGPKEKIIRSGTHTTRKRIVFRFKCQICGHWMLGSKDVSGAIGIVKEAVA